MVSATSSEGFLGDSYFSQCYIRQTHCHNCVSYSYTTRKKTALDRRRTDRISLIHDLNLDLYDLDLQSRVSYGHDLPAYKSSRSMVSQFRRYSGDKRMEASANAVGKNMFHNELERIKSHF